MQFLKLFTHFTFPKPSQSPHKTLTLSPVRPNEAQTTPITHTPYNLTDPQLTASSLIFITDRYNRYNLTNPPAHNIFLDIPKGLTLYKVLRPWLGDGLLLSEGAKWKRNRKLITPAFHFGVLKTYINVFNECIDTAMV